LVAAFYPKRLADHLPCRINHPRTTRWRHSRVSSSSASEHERQVSSVDAPLANQLETHTHTHTPRSTCRSCISGIFPSVPEYMPCTPDARPHASALTESSERNREETILSFWKPGRAGTGFPEPSRSPGRPISGLGNGRDAVRGPGIPIPCLIPD
jgi:hypothetical protein